MVRLKRRWLFVQVEGANSCSTSSTSSSSTNDHRHHHQETTNTTSQKTTTTTTTIITRNDIIRTIRDTMIQQLGQARTVIATETHVRFWDPSTNVLLIRTSREGSSYVRATLPLITTIKRFKAATTTTTTTSSPSYPISFHIRSVHGSTRTVQIAVMKYWKQYYQQRIRWIILQQQQQPEEESRQQQQQHESIIMEKCQELQQLYQSIQSLE